MSKVIIIIGLQGSGKSTLAMKFNSPLIIHKYFDWGWNLHSDKEGEILGSFNEDPRFDELINHIKNNQDVVIDSTWFCNHKFLCGAEYYLNLNFPDIQIEKYYFENNPKKASANVLYRDASNGGYWFRGKNNELVYSGSHYDIEGPNVGRRFYEVIIEILQKMSKNYIIPNRYSPLSIEVQDKKYFKGWKALIRE